MDDPSIRAANTTHDFDEARVLFLDYADAYGLDFGFLDFEFELSYTRATLSATHGTDNSHRQTLQKRFWCRSI